MSNPIHVRTFAVQVALGLPHETTAELLTTADKITLYVQQGVIDVTDEPDDDGEDNGEDDAEVIIPLKTKH